MEARCNKLDGIAQSVHGILTVNGIDLPDREEYVAKSILCYPVGNGGIVIRECQQVGWIDFAWTTKGFVSIRTMKVIISVCTLFEIDYLAMDMSDSTNPRYNQRIAEKIGMQKIDNNLYSIKLR